MDRNLRRYGLDSHRAGFPLHRQPVPEYGKRYAMKHHLTTDYCLWANVSVERGFKEVQRACRALLDELRLTPRNWPSIIECVQCVINHAPVKRLGIRNQNIASVLRTPQEVFTSHKPKRPLLRPLTLSKYGHVKSLVEVRARQVIDIEKCQTALESMQTDVYTRVQKKWEQQRLRHNSRTNVKRINFRKGVFLVKQAVRSKNKLHQCWKGPKRITKIISDQAIRVVFYRVNDENKEA